MGKKKNPNASHWKGYSEEEKRQANMEMMGSMKEDNGFYGKRHCKRQKLF